MICFAWDGFPQYAARCIRTFVKNTNERVVVLATRPSVPIEGMEKLCGCDVVWIDGCETRALLQLLGEIPNIFFVGGWYVPAFNRYRDEVKHNGGLVFAMVDNNYVPSWKEILKAIRFRIFLYNKFDGFMVPGNSGMRLLRAYGVDKKMIVKGMYSADGSIFKNGMPLERREKKIIYVGQFIERKNVVRMVKAFCEANEMAGGDWGLELYGCGPLQCELEAMNARGVSVHSFLQPEALAQRYRDARVFCLPSLEEHWGLVVHEAALSGCVLLLSDKVGSAEDLLGTNNGFSFNPKSVPDMATAFYKAMNMNSEAYALAQSESLHLSNAVNINNFAIGVNTLLKICNC